jgi:uncharacterized protein YqgV (UPF0045/DUF77 family)
LLHHVVRLQVEFLVLKPLGNGRRTSAVRPTAERAWVARIIEISTKDKAGTMLNVEFTIEPFVEGSPGAHVTAAVAAVERCGLSVEFGPFGSSFSVTKEQLPEAIAELMRAAYGNGATYVSVDVGVA